MKTLQANGQGFRDAKTKEPLSNIVKMGSLFFCIWAAPYAPGRGYFGGIYVTEGQPKTETQRENLIKVAVEVEESEEIAVYFRDFSRDSRRGETKKRVLTLAELRRVR